MNSKSKKTFRKAAYIFIAVFVLFLVIFFQFFRIGYSATDSLPYHFYLERFVLIRIKKGEIVSFTMPKRTLKFEKYYLPYDWYAPMSNFAKIVGCVHPERINTLGRKFYCDGKLIAKVPKGVLDLHDKKIWYNYKNEIIPKGYFFALGTNRLSLDSKFLGLIPYKSVNAVDMPL
ncbi:MAG: S26 family signal peptidase [bacterium]